MLASRQRSFAGSGIGMLSTTTVTVGGLGTCARRTPRMHHAHGSQMSCIRQVSIRAPSSSVCAATRRVRASGGGQKSSSMATACYEALMKIWAGQCTMALISMRAPVLRRWGMWHGHSHARSLVTHTQELATISTTCSARRLDLGTLRPAPPGIKTPDTYTCTRERRCECSTGVAAGLAQM
jgi:hypothetical protein